MENKKDTLEELQEIVKDAYNLLQGKKGNTILNTIGDALILAGKIAKFVEAEANKKKIKKT